MFSIHVFITALYIPAGVTVFNYTRRFCPGSFRSNPIHCKHFIGGEVVAVVVVAVAAAAVADGGSPE